MKNSWVISSLSSLAFIVLSGFVTFGSPLGSLSELFFYLHLIPFIIGFAGESLFFIVLYYGFLWVVTTLVFKALIYIYKSLKKD